ncbi:hypothetical protein [Marinobacter sp.]|uniref:hypothetical protein n=1 Tax=Marinobacter sp. TaxID=50741 RepID=UPI000C95762B|nr:hypothetical protein [Marinobacter sp.]MAB51156.1 DNA polymerase [Marinobacter sp.]|tara:strand:- start:1628 stop:2299 length:672 start_codon:yes stop_codon:yes gene_type:complete
MKISGETLQVLKNFASINTNIVFKPGDTIATISSAKNIFARAKIKEEIPNQFAIYDLNSLLAMISLVDDQEVKFEDNKLQITSASGTFEYFYSNPEVVTAAPDVAIDHDAVYKFKLTAEDIQMILKAAAITNAPTVSVSNKEQSVTIKVGDRKNDSSNSFQKVIGSAFDDFDVFVAVENLKVIPDAYEVSVAKTKNGKAKFLHFKHESKELQYWIAAEPGSNV